MATTRVLLLALMIAAGCGDDTPYASDHGAHVDADLDPKRTELVVTPEPGVLRHVGRRFTLLSPPSG